MLTDYEHELETILLHKFKILNTLGNFYHISLEKILVTGQYLQHELKMQGFWFYGHAQQLLFKRIIFKNKIQFT